MWSNKQRDVLADKLTDLANIAVGSLVFGYILKSDVFNPYSLVLGLLIATSAYVYAMWLGK